MSDEAEPDEVPEEEVPEGAAVFPTIPPELDVNPLLLAVLHATVFLAGSDESIVNPSAADEAVGTMAEYLVRLKGPLLRQVQEDISCLVAYARQQKWPRQLVLSLKSFLSDYGVGERDDESEGEGEE
jgi:hypothetical protein